MRALLMIVALCWALPSTAHVAALEIHLHEPGKTFTAIALSSDGVRVLFTVPRADLARLANEADSPGRAVADHYAALVKGGIRLDNVEAACALQEFNADEYDAIDAYQYSLLFQCPGELDFLALHYTLFAADVSHQNFTEVVYGEHVLQTVLGSYLPDLDIPVAHLAWERGWQLPSALPRLAGERPTLPRYFVLGFEHVMQGYDHLAFVIGLALVVFRTRELLMAITAFTLAHSLTLGLSAAGVLLVPVTFTEPAIALSILYVGLENLLLLWRRNGAWLPVVVAGGPARAGGPAGAGGPTGGAGGFGIRLSGAGNTASSANLGLGGGTLSRRWLVAFAFGLVHGFGFSYLLRDVGLPEDAFLLSLAAFNVGVEAGQIGAVLLPFLVLRLLIARSAFALGFVWLGSLAVAGLGGYWFIERLWG